MELKDGNEYTIPFVLFSSRSLRLLRGGWEAWLAASESKDYNSLNDESFRLQAQAAAIIRNQEISQQIAMTQYNLDLVRSGITSLWEVTLYPGRAIHFRRGGSWPKGGTTSKPSAWRCSRIRGLSRAPCDGFGRRVAAPRAIDASTRPSQGEPHEVWEGERPGKSEPVAVDKSVPSMGQFALTDHLFTAKRLYLAAQAQRRSRATLGSGRQPATIPPWGWTAEEQAFAKACQKALGVRELGMATAVAPFVKDLKIGGSSDSMAGSMSR